MGQIKVASRYAKSLLQLAAEQKKEDVVKADMALIKNTLDESKDLQLLLKSPIVREDKKGKIIEQIFGNKIDQLSLQFVSLLTSKGREAILEEICVSYLSQNRAKNNVQKVVLISAAPLDEGTKKEILDKVNQEGKTFEVEEQIDPELIGGFIVKLGDKQVDASVLGSFRKLKKEFKNNPFVANF